MGTIEMVENSLATKSRRSPGVKRALLLVFAVVLVGAVAIPFISKRGEREKITRAISEARQIVTALRIYSADHDGEYPASLHELVTAGTLPESLLYRLLPDGSKEARWIYFPGLKDSDGESRPVIVEADPKDGRMFVGLNDSSIVTDRDLQSFLNRHGLTMPDSKAGKGRQP